MALWMTKEEQRKRLPPELALQVLDRAIEMTKDYPVELRALAAVDAFSILSRLVLLGPVDTFKIRAMKEILWRGEEFGIGKHTDLYRKVKPSREERENK